MVSTSQPQVKTAEVSDFAHFFEDGTKAKMASEIKPPFKIDDLNSEITSPDQERRGEKNEQDEKFSVNNIQLEPT